MAGLKRERALASAGRGGKRRQRSLPDSIGTDNLSLFNYLAAWKSLGSRSMRRSG
jgi:hypothetical protein